MRRAWQQLARVHHPDTGGSTQAFLRLSGAFARVARDLAARKAWLGRLPPRVDDDGLEEEGPVYDEAPVHDAASSEESLQAGSVFEVLGIAVDGRALSVEGVRVALTLLGERPVLQVDFARGVEGLFGTVALTLSWRGEVARVVRSVTSRSCHRGRTTAVWLGAV